jgi:hypothetical protein
MGYELHVVGVALGLDADILDVSLTVTNTGVAPFYYDWPVQLAALDADERLTATWSPDWELTRIIPGDLPTVWQTRVDTSTLLPGTHQLLLRVANPLPNGPPLRFANECQDRHRPGWLTLGEFVR